jgi:hypothetical protein
MGNRKKLIFDPDDVVVLSGGGNKDVEHPA